LIYLDNSAHHPILQCVKQKIYETVPLLCNPSSSYSCGRNLRSQIENSRKIVADFINCDADEIVFTSGATESNAIAMNTFPNDTISFYEHDGLRLNPKAKINEAPDMIMLVNNEVGENYTDFIMNNPIVYSDTTAAMGNITVDVKTLDLKMAGFSAEKLGALSGCGVLYVKNCVSINPIIYGHQEKGCRGGTENTLGIIALGEAIKYAKSHIEEKYKHCEIIKQTLLDELTKTGIDFIVNGNNTIPQICSVSFKGVEGEGIGLWLDKYGICVAHGSACNSGNLEPSKVLQAMNIPKNYINGTIRFSFNLENTIDEIKYVVEKINEFVKMVT